MVVERHGQADAIDERGTLVLNGALDQRHDCALSPEKLRATNVAPSRIAMLTRSIGRVLVADALLGLPFPCPRSRKIGLVNP